MKGKKLQPRICYAARFLFRFHGEIKSFTDRQKLIEFSTTKPVLQQILRELRKEKREATTINKKLQMRRLINESKHIVKVGNHPHTNVISKPGIL